MQPFPLPSFILYGYHLFPLVCLPPAFLSQISTGLEAFLWFCLKITLVPKARIHQAIVFQMKKQIKKLFICLIKYLHQSLFILFTGLSRQEYWIGLPFPSPVDNVLLESSIMTRPSWVACHGMAHCFTEFHKAVIHMIILVDFLWLWSFVLEAVGW